MYFFSKRSRIYGEGQDGVEGITFCFKLLSGRLNKNNSLELANRS